jgi:hypothetical protein
MQVGIPAAERDLVSTCRYSDIENLQRIFDEHPGGVARVLLELSRGNDCNPSFSACNPRANPAGPSARSKPSTTRWGAT